MPDFFDDPEQYLPITWDGCGNNDCLLLRPGFGEGAVVFLDHEKGEGPAYLVAGSIQGFLTMWTDSLVYRYDAQGKLNPKCQFIELEQWPFLKRSEHDHPWPFDLEWMQANDPPRHCSSMTNDLANGFRKVTEMRSTQSESLPTPSPRGRELHRRTPFPFREAYPRKRRHYSFHDLTSYTS